MKKGIIKAGGLLACFVISLVLFSFLLNEKDSSLTSAMAPASLPVIHAQVDGYTINLMRGVSQGVEVKTLRDSVAPLSADRKIKFLIDLGETEVEELSYQVRSLDGEEFLEDTKVELGKAKDERIETILSLKNLLEENTEYLLNLTLTLKNNQKYNYVTRVIMGEDLHTKEKLEFVQDFHNKTFVKEDAKSLIKNLESNSSGDNSHFQKVNIHSSFDMVTFGDLEISQVGDAEYFIKDQDAEVAVIVAEYIAQSNNQDGTNSKYRVEEYYRIRYTSQRIYLLDFERTMEEYFQPEQGGFGKNNINLGVADENTAYAYSQDGKQTAFVTGGELWSLNQKENKLYRVFSFLNQDYTNVRTNGGQHDIKILSINENGDIDFLVYGYMSRGKHEGEIGIAAYRFSCQRNCTEEVVFIPASESYELLADAVGQLAYINENSELFLMLGGMLYNIDLKEKTYQIVAEGLSDKSFSISEEGSKIVWQPNHQRFDSMQLNMLDLESGKQKEIKVSEEERILPVGFMKGDFIYGVARTADVDLNRTFVPFPMYKLCILDEKGKLTKEYEAPGIFIKEAGIEGNVINLERVKIGNDGFEDAEADHMVNNEITEEAQVSMVTIKTEEKKTQVQIKYNWELPEKSRQLLTPKQVIYEENREIALEKQPELECYYVFAKGHIESTFGDAKEAMERANESAGCVLNTNFDYVWQRGNRKTKVKLMEIGNAVMGAGSSSTDICANTILQMEGKAQSPLSNLQAGQSLVNSLRESLETTDVYNLTGATLSQVLYYVNRGCPVMAMLDKDTMGLIVGYDKLNTIVMNPERGEVYYVGMNDSTAMFEAAGNVFYAYLH